MNKLGIIAEYNPFHSGHKYQLERAKALTNCDNLTVIMSGNYVQRGEPALLDKWTRAEMAVNGGADLVVELPLPFACQNAELFANAAILELKKLRINTISFGCESTDIENLFKIAKLQVNDDKTYNKLVKQYMLEGISYAAANTKAVEELLGKKISENILTPNNMLGLEYIKSAMRNNYHPKFIPIKRIGANHNDDGIINSEFASATTIRKEIKDNRIHNIKDVLPVETYNTIKDKSVFNSLNNYLDLIYYKIIMGGKEYLKNIYDVKEGLENKIYNNVYKHTDIDSFILSLKSKRYAYSRLRRVLLNILLDITYDDIDYFKSNPSCYTKVLAFNDKGKDILRNAKAHGVPIITKFSDFKRNGIDANKDRLFEITDKATNLYYMPYMDKSSYYNYEHIKNVIYLK